MIHRTRFLLVLLVACALAAAASATLIESRDAPPEGGALVQSLEAISADPGESFELAGEVTYASTGGPASGVAIRLQRQSASGSWEDVASATTDGNGEYSFTRTESSSGVYRYRTLVNGQQLNEGWTVTVGSGATATTTKPTTTATTTKPTTTATTASPTPSPTATGSGTTYAQARTDYISAATAWGRAWGASDIATIRQYLVTARASLSTCLATAERAVDPAHAADLSVVKAVSAAYIDLADAAIAMYGAADSFGAGRAQLTAGSHAAAATSFGSAGEQAESARALFARAAGTLQAVSYAGTEFADGAAYTATIVPLVNGKAAYMGEYATYARGWQHTALAYGANANGDAATFRSEATQAMNLFAGLRTSPAFGADATSNYNILAAQVGSGTPTPTPTGTAPPGAGPKAVLAAGDTVYVGEYGLDLSPIRVADGTTLGWFGAGANVAADSPDDTIIVANAKAFNVVPGTRTGAWYNLNGNRALAITVRDPSLAIRVWDVKANTDVTGTTLNALDGRSLSFRVDSNLDAVHAQRGVPATVTIRVRNPYGRVYTALRDDIGNINDLAGVPIVSPAMLVQGKGTKGAMWDTINEDPDHPYTIYTGRYEVWAECDLNGMRANYKDPSGADYVGKTVASKVGIVIGDTEVRTITWTPTA